MEKKILDALIEKYSGVKESILRRVATKLAKTVDNEDDIATAVDGAFADVLEAYGDQRATDAQKTAVANYERKHNLKDGKAIDGGEPENDEPDQQDADEAPAWAKTLIEDNKSLKERLDKLDADRQTKSRRDRLDEVIAKLPDHLKRGYQRMSLEGDEEAFAAALDEVKTEVDDILAKQGSRGAVFSRPQQSTADISKASQQESDEFKKLMGL